MNNGNSPTKQAGYANAVYNLTPASWSHVYEGHSASKVYQYVMDRGAITLAPGDIGEDFMNDAISMTIPSVSGVWPETAVVLMTKANNDNAASLIVDLENKFIWIGESQMFWYSSYLDDNRGTFLSNLMRLVGNASMYGSHFTDLLLESGPNAQPAPWDSHWGENAEAQATYDE